MKINVKFIFKVIFDAKRTASRFDPKFKEAQKWLDNEVVKDTTPNVPMDTGRLYKSAIEATKYGSGEVVYNTPYARPNYYGKNRNFSKLKHPQAQAQWFEPSKAANKKKWIDGVNKIVRK